MIDLLTREESIAACGVALVMPQLRGLQSEGDKQGSGAKVAHAKPAQATKYLIERVEEAKSADEVLELYANARVAADLADPDALSPGELRLSHFDYSDGKVPELLVAETKEVAPRRSPKQKKLEKAA